MLRERATLPLRRRKFVSCSSVWIGMHAPINWFLTRNGKTAKVRDFRKFATRNLGSLAVPFQGWSVIFLPVRSTVVALLQDFKVFHAFCPRIGATDSTPPAVFISGDSAASAMAALRIPRLGPARAASDVFRTSLT